MSIERDQLIADLDSLKSELQEINVSLNTYLKKVKAEKKRIEEENKSHKNATAAAAANSTASGNSTASASSNSTTTK